MVFGRRIQASRVSTAFGQNAIAFRTCQLQQLSSETFMGVSALGELQDQAPSREGVEMHNTLAGRSALSQVSIHLCFGCTAFLFLEAEALLSLLLSQGNLMKAQALRGDKPHGLSRPHVPSHVPVNSARLHLARAVASLPQPWGGSN